MEPSQDCQLFPCARNYSLLLSTDWSQEKSFEIKLLGSIKIKLKQICTDKLVYTIHSSFTFHYADDVSTKSSALPKLGFPEKKAADEKVREVTGTMCFLTVRTCSGWVNLEYVDL